MSSEEAGTASQKNRLNRKPRRLSRTMEALTGVFEKKDEDEDKESERGHVSRPRRMSARVKQARSTFEGLPAGASTRTKPRMARTSATKAVEAGESASSLGSGAQLSGELQTSTDAAQDHTQNAQGGDDEGKAALVAADHTTHTNPPTKDAQNATHAKAEASEPLDGAAEGGEVGHSAATATASQSDEGKHEGVASDETPQSVENPTKDATPTAAVQDAKQDETKDETEQEQQPAEENESSETAPTAETELNSSNGGQNSGETTSKQPLSAEQGSSEPTAKPDKSVTESVPPTKNDEAIDLVEHKTVTVERAPFGLTASNLLVIRVWGEADKQGVTVGDKITSVNRNPVKTNRQMKEYFADAVIPFPITLRVGNDRSIAKANQVLARLAKQEQEQEERDRLLSRKNSEARPSDVARWRSNRGSDGKALPTLEGRVLKKREFWGGRAQRFLKLHNKCLFYSHDERALETKEQLAAAEAEYKQLVAKGSKKTRTKSKVVVIPIEKVTVTRSPSGNGITLTLKEAKGSRQFTFEPPKGTGSIYDKWAEAILAHKAALAQQ